MWLHRGTGLVMAWWESLSIRRPQLHSDHLFLIIKDCFCSVAICVVSLTRTVVVELAYVPATLKFDQQWDGRVILPRFHQSSVNQSINKHVCSSKSPDKMINFTLSFNLESNCAEQLIIRISHLFVFNFKISMWLESVFSGGGTLNKWGVQSRHGVCDLFVFSRHKKAIVVCLNLQSIQSRNVSCGNVD